MGKSYSFLNRLVFVGSDFFILNASYFIANAFYAFSDLPLISWDGLKLAVFFNVTWLISASIMRLYAASTFLRIEHIFRQSWKTLVIHALLFTITLYLLNIDVQENNFFILFYCILIVLIGLSRFFLTYLSQLITRTRLHKKIAIIGYNQTGMELAKYFKGNDYMYSFQGFFDDESEHFSINKEGRIVGPIEKCMDFAVKNNITEIYSTIFPEEHDDITKVIDLADRHCVHVKFVPDKKTVINENYYHLEYLGDFPIISLRSEPLQKLNSRIKKRLFDIIFSSLVIIFILSWLTPILAILIKLESKGPVFFKQLRSGKDNKPFWCYKFRSMKVNDKSDVLQATREDNRVTFIGSILRKTSLDEFPQFFNVWVGDMSIVGPRPHMLMHTEKYSALINKYMVRQFLKPGVSGWAQVNGYRGQTKNTEMMGKRVEYDIWYIENWSLMFDVRIVFMTIINILKGEDTAY